MKTAKENEIHLEFYSRRHSDFDLVRLAQAKARKFSEPVTGYLCGAFVHASACVGIVFDHVRRDANGLFEDGHLIRTSEIVSVHKEGRFWVMTTLNSHYVIATFQRGNGRSSLSDFIGLSCLHHGSAHLLH